MMSEWMQEEECNMGLGPNLVTNGGFDVDVSEWDGAGLGWSDGRASLNDFGGPARMSQGISFTVQAAKQYELTFDFEKVSGTFLVASFDFVLIGEYTTSGSKSILFTVEPILNPGDVQLKLGGNVTGYIDNVSLREVTGGLSQSMIDQFYLEEK
jgi:hypothetical protein